MAVPHLPFNPLFVRMLRVFGFALPPLPLHDQLTCSKCGPDPSAATTSTLAMQACWKPSGAPSLSTWTQTKGFILWFAVCALAYVADCLQTQFWGYHLHPMVVMLVWPPLYLAAQRQLTLLASYRKALELMGTIGKSNMCCEPDCCQTGCCKAFSCCGCPCGKDPLDTSGASDDSSANARLLGDSDTGSLNSGMGKEEAYAATLTSLVDRKAYQMFKVLRYRWSLGLGLLAYIAVVGCVIGVFGVNFIGQVFGGRLPASASASVKLAVLCHGFLGSLNYGMLGPSIAAWVGSTWALMYCHKMQCWDWEEAVSAYKEGATELQLRAAKEEEAAEPGARPSIAVGELTASSESEARFVDSAISAYTALREDLEVSHGIVILPIYVFMGVLAVLFVLGFRDSVLASLPIGHFGQGPMLVLAPFIALVILMPLINLSITLDKVTKSFADKRFSWGALSLNSRVFISLHIDKNPIFYDANINIRAVYGLLGTAAASIVSVVYPLILPKG